MIQLPNALTLLRILLVPVFALAFTLPGETARLASFVIFCIAGASDILDGLAARKLRARSEFGRMLDPIADKILVAAALMMLVASGVISGYELIPALVILAREILVSGLRPAAQALRGQAGHNRSRRGNRRSPCRRSKPRRSTKAHRRD